MKYINNVQHEIQLFSTDQVHFEKVSFIFFQICWIKSIESKKAEEEAKEETENTEYFQTVYSFTRQIPTEIYDRSSAVACLLCDRGNDWRTGKRIGWRRRKFDARLMRKSVPRRFISISIIEPWPCHRYPRVESHAEKNDSSPRFSNVAFVSRHPRGVWRLFTAANYEHRISSSTFFSINAINHWWFCSID